MVEVVNTPCDRTVAYRPRAWTTRGRSRCRTSSAPPRSAGASACPDSSSTSGANVTTTFPSRSVNSAAARRARACSFGAGPTSPDGPPTRSVRSSLSPLGSPRTTTRNNAAIALPSCGTTWATARSPALRRSRSCYDDRRGTETRSAVSRPTGTCRGYRTRGGGRTRAARSAHGASSPPSACRGRSSRTTAGQGYRASSVASAAANARRSKPERSGPHSGA